MRCFSPLPSCLTHRCIYRIYFEQPKFLSESTFIIQRTNRHHPNVLNGCLDQETAVAKLAAPSSLMCFIAYSTGTIHQETKRDVPACPLQYTNCTAENSTYLKMQIFLMQNTGGMAQENIREVNYVSKANKGPTTKSLTAITGK